MNKNNIEFSLTRLSHKHHNLDILCVYRSNLRASVTQPIQAFEQLYHTVQNDENRPIIILGDLNVNLMEISPVQHHLSSFMLDYKGYTQLIHQHTTDYSSQLDHIYTNVPHSISYSGALESYYSDHKPIYASLKIT